MRCSSSTTQAAAHTGSRAPVTRGSATACSWESTAVHGVCPSTETGRPCSIGATATTTSSRVKVFSEAKRPPGESSSSATLVEHFHAGRLVGEAGTLDRSAQLDRRVTGAGQLVPPTADQVLHLLVGLAVAGGPSRHRPGLVGGIGADGFVDLGRAGGVDLPRFPGDAGDGPTAQAS